MDMSMREPIQSASEAGVRAQLVTPPTLEPGTPIPVAYRLADARTGAPLTDVVVSHERPLHLIIVSADLGQFQHVHPVPTGQPGEYALGVIFPEAGSYVLYAGFCRANGRDILQRDVLPVGPAVGVTPESGSSAASLAEDGGPKTLGDVRVTLRRADAVRAGQEARLTFGLEDARTGQGIRDLRPYLGAPAHVVILSEDAQVVAHTHGEQVGAGMAGHGGQASAEHGAHGAAGALFGPEIAFHHTFPTPGLYKVWGQFLAHDGHVITADFVIRAR